MRDTRPEDKELANGFHDGRKVTRAKVWVSDVTSRESGQNPSYQNKPPNYRVQEVTFTFVNGNDKDGENSKFWDATPTTQPFKMIIVNPKVHGIFEVGKEYYLDLVEALPDD